MRQSVYLPMGSKYHSRLEINLSAIGKNVAEFRKHFQSPTKIMAIIKANAYGTDYSILSAYLKQIDVEYVGAANLLEAQFFHSIGISQKIFVINSTWDEAEQIVSKQFETAVDNMKHIEILERESKRQKKETKVHLFVETGMGRFGCSSKECLTLARRLHTSRHLIFEGFCSHFSSAEDKKKDAFTREQYRLFVELLNQMQKEGIDPKYKHMANTAASIRFDLPQCNMARIGIGLYGFVPMADSLHSIDLVPALDLKSEIIHLSTFDKGHPIGYDATYRVKKKKEVIAIVPLGYFDGIHQIYHKHHVLIRGKKAPIVGKICMDNFMVDVTHIPGVSLSDEVLIFGKDKKGNELSPLTWANKAGVDIRQFLCCLGVRIEREIKYLYLLKKPPR